jgi:bla regulator protein BlaR1
MTLADFSPLANHIWQSSVFVVAAWVVTLALRKNRASVRYWVWFAASVKFLIPFSVLISLGSKFAWQSSAAITRPQFANVIDEIGQPFATLAGASAPAATPHASSALPLILVAVWLCGVVVGLIFWVRSVREVRAIKRAATALPFTLSIPVMSSPERMEPGVFGIFNPVLILPEGIIDRLTPAQLKSVIAHELCHVQRKDNLTAAIHMLVETILWFHPFVWWIRTRLVAERERACDETVVSVGSDPQVYSEAILNVCKHYIESPLQCVSGVTGSNLKKRIRAIMAGRVGGELTSATKALLAILALAAIAVPVVFGLAGAMPKRAEAQTVADFSNYKFEVVSVKPGQKLEVGGVYPVSMQFTADGFVAENAKLNQLVNLAYGLSHEPVWSEQASGGSDWYKSRGYSIDAKMSEAVAEELKKLRPNQRSLAQQHMLQALLADRFKLTVHNETREAPTYFLVVAKKGKLHPAKGDCDPAKNPPPQSWADGKWPVTLCGRFVGYRGHLGGLNVTVAQLAGNLPSKMTPGDYLPVLDKTGLAGKYDIILDWTPDEILPSFPGVPAAEIDRPPLATAIQEQLGLKLERGKAPADVLVIDHVERPSGN